MLSVLLAVVLAVPVEVERVLALVNGVPVLASDVELAQIAQLVPREPAESEADHRRAVVEALVALELRWQDLQAAGVVQRLEVDEAHAWQSVVGRAGGGEAVGARLAAAGLGEPLLRELVRRAAVIEVYVTGRFAPFVRPTGEEVERVFREELLPSLPAGTAPPDLKTVRPELETLLRERKLIAEVDRWTHDLEARGEVVRYLR
jgi:hypothetical protein